MRKRSYTKNIGSHAEYMIPSLTTQALVFRSRRRPYAKHVGSQKLYKPRGGNLSGKFLQWGFCRMWAPARPFSFPPFSQKCAAVTAHTHFCEKGGKEKGRITVWATELWPCSCLVPEIPGVKGLPGIGEVQIEEEIGFQLEPGSPKRPIDRKMAVDPACRLCRVFASLAQ
jgi:hypothetical protein